MCRPEQTCVSVSQDIRVSPTTRVCPVFKVRGPSEGSRPLLNEKEDGVFTQFRLPDGSGERVPLVDLRTLVGLLSLSQGDG